MRTYTKEELDKVKTIELGILIEIVRLCKKNNISYFTVGGTTLGAIRHNGFIPWDDDIDIGMLRNDYDRFLMIAKKELNPDYGVLNHEENKNFPSYFTKIYKKGTTFLEEDTANLNYEHGIFLDVFPFDNLPNDLKKRQKAKRKIVFYDQLFKSKMLWKISKVSVSKHKTLSKIIRVILHVFLVPVSKEFLYKKMQYYSKKYNSIECDVVSSCGRNVLETKKCFLLPTISHKFENIDVEIPNNYNEILKHQFGNYMQLPPEDKRVSHCPLVLEFTKKDNN